MEEATFEHLLFMLCEAVIASQDCRSNNDPAGWYKHWDKMLAIRAEATKRFRNMEIELEEARTEMFNSPTPWSD